jgi:hypothetical protein
MKNSNDKSLGILLIQIFSILFFLNYYFFRPLYWGVPWETIAATFTLSYWALFVWIDRSLSVIGIIAVIYGFNKRKNWARLYIIGITLYSSFWNIYLLFIVRVWPYERYLWFIYYTLVIMYLLLEPTREYFGVKKFLA